MWDPKLYLRFADERGRPFRELVARVGAASPRAVVDLGCGPGNLTQTLVERWPKARVTGIDSSPEMIEEARAKTQGVAYEVGDVRDYVPAEDVDVIVTNAALQWVPGHDELLTRWVADGRWIAMQVPANSDEPGHVLLRELVDQFGLDQADWRSTVGDAVHYARLLRASGCDVDAWETNYIHQLPVTQGAPHPVATWLGGTALRPVRAALSDADFQAFSAQFEAGLWTRYPPDNGVVDFPFPRVFAVAHR